MADMTKLIYRYLVQSLSVHRSWLTPTILVSKRETKQRTKKMQKGSQNTMP